jgi:hypothetical protein
LHEVSDFGDADDDDVRMMMPEFAQKTKHVSTEIMEKKVQEAVQNRLKPQYITLNPKH